MDGSGLTEGLETIFGGNALKKMLSGKAISRALRAHFLIESALITKLMTNIFPVTENEASFDVNEVVDDGDIEMDSMEDETTISLRYTDDDNFDADDMMKPRPL